MIGDFLYNFKFGVKSKAWNDAVNQYISKYGYELYNKNKRELAGIAFTSNVKELALKRRCIERGIHINDYGNMMDAKPTYVPKPISLQPKKPKPLQTKRKECPACDKSGCSCAKECESCGKTIYSKSFNECGPCRSDTAERLRDYQKYA